MVGIVVRPWWPPGPPLPRASRCSPMLSMALPARDAGRGAPGGAGHPRRAGRGPMSGVVVIGTGFGCMTHVRALRAAGFEVVALVGRDPDKTALRARLLDIPVGLTSVDEATRPRRGGCGDRGHAAPHPRIHRPGRHRCRQARDLREALRPRMRPRGVRCCAAAEEAGVVHLLGCEFRWDPGPGPAGPGGGRRSGGRAPVGHGDPARPLVGRPVGRGSRLVGRRQPGRRMAGRPRLPDHRSGPGDPGRVRVGQCLTSPRGRHGP